MCLKVLCAYRRHMGKNNSITRRISISNGNTFSAKTVTLLNSSPRKTTPDAAYKVYDNLSEQRKELVTPEYLSDEALISQFLSQPYTRLGFNDDDPEFYTANGERVRSKSEILIADALRRHDVPYLCEYPVYNNGVIFAAPDFKCLNKRLRKVYYWEHLGMLGDQDYADRNVKKMDKYILADDFDENRLILTYETDSHPLNTKVIEAKIRKYLL